MKTSIEVRLQSYRRLKNIRHSQKFLLVPLQILILLMDWKHKRGSGFFFFRLHFFPLQTSSFVFFFQRFFSSPFFSSIKWRLYYNLSFFFYFKCLQDIYLSMSCEQWIKYWKWRIIFKKFQHLFCRVSLYVCVLRLSLCHNYRFFHSAKNMTNGMMIKKRVKRKE